MKELLMKRKEIDAVFASNDQIVWERSLCL